MKSILERYSGFFVSGNPSIDLSETRGDIMFMIAPCSKQAKLVINETKDEKRKEVLKAIQKEVEGVMIRSSFGDCCDIAQKVYGFGLNANNAPDRYKFDDDYEYGDGD